MAHAPEPIAIDDVPELVRLAEQVRVSGQLRLLQRGGEIVAAVIPLHLAEEIGGERPLTEDDIEAFESAFSGWTGVDADRLIEEISARRGRPVHPPVER